MFGHLLIRVVGPSTVYLMGGINSKGTNSELTAFHIPSQTWRPILTSGWFAASLPARDLTHCHLLAPQVSLRPSPSADIKWEPCHHLLAAFWSCTAGITFRLGHLFTTSCPQLSSFVPIFVVVACRILHL